MIPGPYHWHAEVIAPVEEQGFPYEQWLEQATDEAQAKIEDGSLS